MRLLAAWTSEEGGNADLPPLAPMAEHVLRSFNARFWSAELGYLYDVVDGEQGDDQSSPQPVFAIALRHPVLDPSHWQPVLDAVERHLLTRWACARSLPVTPTISPATGATCAHATRPTTRERVGLADRAVCRRLAEAAPGPTRRRRPFFEGFWAHLDHGCVGSISEIFDAEARSPHAAAQAQAWSVAETLRCWRLCGLIAAG